MLHCNQKFLTKYDQTSYGNFKQAQFIDDNKFPKPQDMDLCMNRKVKKMKFHHSYRVMNSMEPLIVPKTNMNDFYHYSNHWIKGKEVIEETQFESDDTKTTRSLSSYSTLSQSESFYLIRTSLYKTEPTIEPVELFHGAVLGRTVVSRISGNKRIARNLKDLKRIDLGIGYRNRESKCDDGISQDHIKIIGFEEGGILMKVCDKVRNSVAV